MRSIDVKAKTREEAIEDALRQLGVERHEIHVEILDEGSRGFFGFGAREVCIRVSTESESPQSQQVRPERTSRDSGRRERSDDRTPKRELSRTRAPRSHQQNTRPAQKENKPEKQKDEGRQEEKKPETSKTNTEGRSSRRNGRRSDRNTNRPMKLADSHVTQKSEESQTTVVEKPVNTPPPLTPSLRKPLDDADSKTVASLLEELIRRMGIIAQVHTLTNESGDVILDIESQDSAILIGRNGQTLQAMQYLINRMAHNEDSVESERIIVDTEGYIERRNALLVSMAQRTADKVRGNGRRIMLKPMVPQERRIIHLTLQDCTDIRTFSVGNGALRQVVVAPKEEKATKRAPSRRRRPTRRRGGEGNVSSEATVDTQPVATGDQDES